tara:strand:+ start:8195 stop:9073 length:879 start_codon:yes stop_codon:yes gene_type:complete
LKIKTNFILFLLTVLSCNTVKEFDLQGHRGYRGLYPENSTIGFLKSLDVGVNTIELDVVISKDKHVVVSHEPWISKNICIDQNGNRIINDKENFNIYSMEYNEIKKFDCGIIGNEKFPDQKKISVFKPTLNYVIKIVENYIKEKGYKPVNYNIEIKSSNETDLIFHPDVKEFSELVVNNIKNNKILERTTIQSFDFRVLKYINKNYPEIGLSVLVSENYDPQKNLDDLSFLPDIYSPNYKFINKEDLEYLKKKKIKIIPWTVNSYSDIAKILNLGVDGIISDYPERVLEIKK